MQAEGVLEIPITTDLHANFEIGRICLLFFATFELYEEIAMKIIILLCTVNTMPCILDTTWF